MWNLDGKKEAIMINRKNNFVLEFRPEKVTNPQHAEVRFFCKKMDQFQLLQNPLTDRLGGKEA